MLLATVHDEDSEREAKHKDAIEMLVCQQETVDNKEELEQESAKRDDKQQLLNETNG